MKAWFSWLCTRSPWLGLGLIAVLVVAVLASMHVITSSSYRLSMQWDKGAFELSPAR